MSEAREEILGRVRDALRDVPQTERPDQVVVERSYRTTSDQPPDALVERFAERLRDYGAEVQQVASGAEIARAVQDACRRMRLERLVLAPGVPAAWRPEAGGALVADDGLSASDLDSIDGALTGCAVGIAETGTIALDGGELSGRRAITLVPDHHICVVEAAQIVGSVPEAIRILAPAIRERGAPVTLISGPSASSDIELSRVEGVHGPRHLLVLIVDAA